jgi:hypothetical protein
MLGGRDAWSRIMGERDRLWYEEVQRFFMVVCGVAKLSFRSKSSFASLKLYSDFLASS